MIPLIRTRLLVDFFFRSWHNPEKKCKSDVVFLPSIRNNLIPNQIKRGGTTKGSEQSGPKLWRQRDGSAMKENIQRVFEVFRSSATSTVRPSSPSALLPLCHQSRGVTEKRDEDEEGPV